MNWHVNFLLVGVVTTLCPVIILLSVLVDRLQRRVRALEARNQKKDEQWARDMLNRVVNKWDPLPIKTGVRIEGGAPRPPATASAPAHPPSGPREPLPGDD